METFLNKLLDYYNLTYDDYLSLNKKTSLNEFLKGYHFDDIEEAASLVKKDIKENKKIMIYGDYDSDGVLSTAILVKMFSYLHIEVGYYIPSRYIDGYGLTLDRAKEIVSKGYKLLILIDNGIILTDIVKYLRSEGVDVLILDHHEKGEVLPEANYIIHPFISRFGEYSCSAGFIAYVFSTYILNYNDMYLATLSGISTISDMMPLKEYNRDLVRIILKEYKEGKYLQLDLLKEGDSFDESCISMKIAPKINAVGRVIKDTSINRLIKYFTSDDEKEIKALARWINETNIKRKEVTDKLLLSLDSQAPSQTGVYIFEIDDGLISILANQVLNKEKRPVVCLATSSLDSSCYKGSIRTPKGYNALDILNHLKEYLVTFGGHSFAAGLTISKDKIEEFKKAYKEYLDSLQVGEIAYHVIDINITEIILENYYLIDSFAPFGQDWSAPLFRLKHLKTSSLTYSKNELHIMSSLGFNSRIVGFGYSKKDVSSYPFVDLVGTMSLSSFRDRTYLDFKVSDLVSSWK